MPTKEPVTLRLLELRTRAGLSMRQMAKALEYKGASSYQRYEDPDIFTKSELPMPLVRRLADVLVGRGSPPITTEEVLMLAGLEDLSAPQLRALDEQTWIWCIAELEAGVWREHFEWPRDQWLPVVISTTDNRFPGVRRQAARTAGDSMDELYPPGSLVIFVRFDDIGRAPRDGERVVVIRRRGKLIEATAKEYTRDPRGRAFLRPRSKNPEHTAIPAEPVNGAEQIEIVGLIVGSQRTE